MIGRIISHYKIIEKLGGGGMGVVYHAQDLKLDRSVALKFLPPHIGQDTEDKERFIQEARAASALDHSNICNIHEIDETDEGKLFICMAYYDGETLKSKIEKGKLKIEEALDYTIQITQGLQRAHEKEIIHRDIKPANLMITNDRVVKIVDFGLAKLASQTKITKTGATLGTIAYMSPEQLKGEDVDKRTDLWSLGVVLYEMLTGRLPFRGEYDVALMYSILNENPQDIQNICPNISSELIDVLDRLLEKDPIDRYQSADEVLAILETIKKEAEKKSLPVISSTGKPKGKKLSKILTIPGKLIWIIIGAAAIVVYWLVNQGILKTQTEQPGDQKISIAVMPFENLTGDTLFNIWQGGLPKLFVTLLSASHELSVFDIIESMGQEQFTRFGSMLPTEVSSKTNIEILLKGDIILAGNKLRIQIRLQDVISGEVIKSEIEDGSTQDDIFNMVENISYRLMNFYEIRMIEQEVMDYEFRNVLTNSAKAYRYYLRGMEAFNKQDQKNAIDWFNKAIGIDTNFTMAYFFMAYAYNHLALFGETVERMKEAKKWAKKAYSRYDEMPYLYQLLLEAHRCEFEKKEIERREWFRKVVEIDPNFWEAWFNIGLISGYLNEPEQAVEPLEKAIQLADNWSNYSKLVMTGFVLAIIHHDLGQYQKEFEVSEKILAIFPKNPGFVERMATSYACLGDKVLAQTYFNHALQIWEALDRPNSQINLAISMAQNHLEIGDTAEAQIYFYHGRRMMEEQGWSEAQIALKFGEAYSGVRYYNISPSQEFRDRSSILDLDKAEKYLRQAISEQPEFAAALNSLAYLLIDKDKNVDEGVELAQRAVIIDPGNPEIMSTLGWGHYKLGNYEQAVKLLQQATNLVPKNDLQVQKQLAKARNSLSGRQ